MYVFESEVANKNPTCQTMHLNDFVFHRCAHFVRSLTKNNRFDICCPRHIR